MSELKTESFSIMSYLKIFFRRKELIVIPTFMGLVFGICAGIVMPKEFLSSTVIVVEEGKTDNPLFSNLAVSTTVRERLLTIKESMLGWKSLVKLVKRLNLDKDIKTTRNFENLILGIRGRIDIKLKGTNIIYLSYIGPDPVQTQAVVKNITDIFIERNQTIQSEETSNAINFIEEQLKVYKGKIKSAEIAKLQDQLDELLVDSTERHPLVRQLRERITNKKAELAQENLEFTEGDRLKIESSNPLIDSIKSALDNLETPTPGAAAVAEPTAAGTGEVMKVMLLDKLDNVLARDAKVNEGIYNVLLQRLETAKITQRLQASKEGTKYDIIEEPRIPLSPVKPNIPLVAMTGLFIGLILGFGLVFAVEFLDKSFIDVEEAKEFFGVPLLGAISKITTEDTIRQEFEQQRWLYSLTFVAGIIVIVVTFALSNFIK